MKLSNKQKRNLNWYEILATESMLEISEYGRILKKITLQDWEHVKPLLKDMAKSKINVDPYWSQAMYFAIKTYYPTSDN
jgi:hypothetical protein